MGIFKERFARSAMRFANPYNIRNSTPISKKTLFEIDCNFLHCIKFQS